MSDRPDNMESIIASITTTSSPEELRRLLSTSINELILSDFDKLVLLLYRLDIDEVKLRKILKENNGADAGNIIADLIIDRQVQKIKSRRHFNQRDNNISEEDRW